MALNRNLFSPEFVYMLNGTNDWIVQENCTTAVQVNKSIYPRTLDSDELLPSVRVRAEQQGDVRLRTPRVEVDAGSHYKFAAWILGDVARDAEVILRFFTT